MGDASLFTRADQTELSWALFDPIINYWEDPLHLDRKFTNPDPGGRNPRRHCCNLKTGSGFNYAGSTVNRRMTVKLTNIERTESARVVIRDSSYNC